MAFFKFISICQLLIKMHIIFTPDNPPCKRRGAKDGGVISMHDKNGIRVQNKSLGGFLIQSDAGEISHIQVFW
jgi:hypothetical protein